MPDLSRYLPLSQRPRHDETTVTSHWGTDIAAILRPLITTLRALEESDWDRPSLRADWSIRENAAHLVARLSATRRQNATATTFGLLENLLSIRAAETAIARRSASASTTAEIVEGLEGVADAAARGDGRTGIRELDAVMLAALDIWIPLGIDPVLPQTASGAVALRRALIAPTEIKAVIRGCSLSASDADWSFGHGPVLTDTAVGLLLFLTGRSTDAPRRA